MNETGLSTLTNQQSIMLFDRPSTYGSDEDNVQGGFVIDEESRNALRTANPVTSKDVFFRDIRRSALPGGIPMGTPGMLAVGLETTKTANAFALLTGFNIRRGSPLNATIDLFTL